MNIGRQWNDRLRIWAEQFPKNYVKKAAALELTGFTSMEHLAFDQAVKGPFAPAPKGMTWGKKWEYGWFRAAFTVPGDGDFDFTPVFDILSDADYEGWVVVEAEQDPAKANPYEYACIARKYISEKTGL